ncbi:hypothetical protein NW768_007214 [Fusarium equiseti]|uniref:Uncharacterized protein n=1 Tax=Fusarium equiseti TaxID=61235 RepID=A0ABQ8RAN6_FUSEQ|nr:hypothetical protein NW768_007214 [Fusarium equiseti]
MLEAILQEGTNTTHVCEDLRRLLPRMEHVHFDLEPLCDAMLGTWDAGESFNPISLAQVRSLHMTCAGYARLGKRGCVGRHHQAQPLTDEGIFYYEDWTKSYPRKKPMLVVNERKVGRTLVDAELQEGYEKRILMEHTPAGFMRYGAPALGYWRLYTEDDEPPEGWDHDILRGPVG